MNNDPLLEVRAASCGYGNRPVLKDISFSVPAGSLYGIIGPNGSGKTTLLRLISRMLKPRAGTVLFEGGNFAALNARVRAQKIAVVSQSEPSLAITVQEYVLLGRIPYRRGWQLFETDADERAVREALSLTGIADLCARTISTLSGGERQLAAIARALAQGPRLLLLDEPTNHLDIAHQVQILDLVRRLNRDKRITVLAVLHDLNLASEYCDELLLLKRGAVRASGAPQEVLTYALIEEVYGTPVVVQANPVSGKPCVFVVTAEQLRKTREKP